MAVHDDPGPVEVAATLPPPEVIIVVLAAVIVVAVTFAADEIEIKNSARNNIIKFQVCV